MATVPDNTTFNMQDVQSVVGGSGLVAMFSNAVDKAFDGTYKGSKDGLLNFRNYDSAYSAVWDGYIVWSFISISGAVITLRGTNEASVRDNQGSSASWKTTLAGSTVESGSVAVSGVNSGNYADATDTCYGTTYDAVWVDSGGGWNQV